ncbi:hypothetical protein K438DRAFT_1972081 [Mycena galopus ATCC 62051]|nr:hypothetical protein K438DRAFT_1972081 [Mycena galopus ATCC 62051]
MVNASTLFFAVLAVASTSALARPVLAREPAGFSVDTSCLGFGYLFGGPHHAPNDPDTMMTTRDHSADGAGIDIEVPSFGSIFGGSDETD